jgi:hypothetical protein
LANSPFQGRFNLRVTRCGVVSIDSRAFDVLDDVSVEDVRSLRLATSSFKPNVPVEAPETSFAFRRVAAIPQVLPLPTERPEIKSCQGIGWKRLFETFTT